jgi:hypothetical protein
MEGADPRPPAAETVPWRQNHPLADLRHMPRIRAFFDFVVAEIEQVRSVLTG